VGSIPFDDLNRSTRERVNHFVQRCEEHAKVREAEAGFCLRVVGKLRGIAVALTESTQILSANRFDALGIDFFYAR
jgi:hypothetical protein